MSATEIMWIPAADQAAHRSIHGCHSGKGLFGILRAVLANLIEAVVSVGFILVLEIGSQVLHDGGPPCEAFG